MTEIYVYKYNKFFFFILPCPKYKTKSKEPNIMIIQQVLSTDLCNYSNILVKCIYVDVFGNKLFKKNYSQFMI